MKKQFVFLTLLAVMFSAAAQDTVRYGDSVYMFNSPQPGICYGAEITLSTSRMWQVHMAQRYQSDTTVRIYGIAMTAISNSSDRLFGNTYHDSIDSVTSPHCLVATLFQRNEETGILEIIDSVQWHYPMDWRWFEYYGVNQNGAEKRRAVESMEYYFEQPHDLQGEFYVGIKVASTGVTGDTCKAHRFYNYLGEPSRSLIIEREFLLAYDTTNNQNNWIYFEDVDDYTTEHEGYTSWMGGVAEWLVDYGWCKQLGYWGCLFPILQSNIPPCPQPDALWQVSRTSTTATLAWDTIDDAVELAVDTAYQGSADSAGFVVNLAAGSAGHTVTGLQPDQWYGAWLRRQCHWVEPTFDTLVWSPWTQVTLFSTAAEGIAMPEMVGPEFNVYSNPAHGSFRVETEVLPSTLLLYDQRGRELYRATLRARQTTIGIADLPRGVYHVSLTATDGRSSTRRLVVD